jgi:hypothetical protein
LQIKISVDEETKRQRVMEAVKQNLDDDEE